MLNAPMSNAHAPQVEMHSPDFPKSSQPYRRVAGLHHQKDSSLTVINYNVNGAEGVLLNRDFSPTLFQARKSEPYGLMAAMFP